MVVVQPHELRAVWPQVEHWITAAVERGQGDENELDVLIALARGVYLLFHEPDQFAAIVAIQQFPAQKVGTIVYFGGRGIEAIKAGFEAGKAWGRANGIDVVRTYGRPGWERFVNLKKVGVILQDEL
jgi:hypothetical protein